MESAHDAYYERICFPFFDHHTIFSFKEANANPHAGSHRKYFVKCMTAWILLMRHREMIICLWKLIFCLVRRLEINFILWHRMELIYVNRLKLFWSRTKCYQSGWSFYLGSASTRNESGSLSDFLLAGARENHRDFPRDASHFRARTPAESPSTFRINMLNEGFKEEYVGKNNRASDLFLKKSSVLDK